MKIAFDYGGVLQTHDWLREMAKALLKAGHEVYCITAIPHEKYGIETHDQRYKAVTDLDIPFTSIVITYHDMVKAENGVVTVTDEQAWEAGREKVKAMKQLGATILVDDLPQIILAVREAGLIGLHLG